MKEEIRNTSGSLEKIKKTVVMEIQVNETGEMGEGRPRNDVGWMVEEVERDNVSERRPRKTADWTHAGALEAQEGGGVLLNIISNSLVCRKFT